MTARALVARHLFVYIAAWNSHRRRVFWKHRVVVSLGVALFLVEIPLFVAANEATAAAQIWVESINHRRLWNF